MKVAVLASALALGAGAPAVALAQWAPPNEAGSPPPNEGGSPSPSGGAAAPSGAQPGGQPQQSIEAGGLAPPAPMAQDPDSAQTEEKLQTADQKDSGRGLEWVYLNAEVGAEHLGLQTFKANNIVDSKVVSTTQTGPVYGAGLGLRLVFITMGARFRLASFSQYQVWTLDAEVGLRIPLGSLEPYFVAGGGYVSLGSFSAANPASNVSVTGYDIRAGGGLDYYVTPVFSIGANLTGDLLGLTRPGVSPQKLQATASAGTPQNQAQAQQSAAAVYKLSGSSLGVGITGTAVLGLHF